ncbi:MAG: hypothetical protein PHW76_09285 [Alphaproteobacteria bacterium]|nr:hypothetical protein [Alphaproteobacteria bacterium]
MSVAVRALFLRTRRKLFDKRRKKAAFKANYLLSVPSDACPIKERAEAEARVNSKLSPFNTGFSALMQLNTPSLKLRNAARVWSHSPQYTEYI